MPRCVRVGASRIRYGAVPWLGRVGCEWRRLDGLVSGMVSRRHPHVGRDTNPLAKVVPFVWRRRLKEAEQRVTVGIHLLELTLREDDGLLIQWRLHLWGGLNEPGVSRLHTRHLTTSDRQCGLCARRTSVANVCMSTMGGARGISDVDVTKKRLSCRYASSLLSPRMALSTSGASTTFSPSIPKRRVCISAFDK